MITGTYGGTTPHTGSNGSFNLTVNQRPTSTVVDCEEPRTIGQASSCTATVSDTGSGTQSDPAGSVDFSRSGAGTGTFSASTCTLVSDGAATFTSSCSVTYTPTSGAGTHTVRADYNEASSAVHATSFGTDDILVSERPTSTVVDCEEPRTIGQASSCTATVSDTGSGTQSDPAGSVDFSRSGAGTGTFSASTCTLVSDGAATFTSSCSVTYTPTSGAGTHTVRADYNEASSAVHATSFGTDDILVSERPTSTVVDCEEPRTIGQASSCTATVSDTGSGTQSDPAGSVDFSRSGAGTGTFSASHLHARLRRRCHLHELVLGDVHAHERCGHAHGARRLQRGLERSARDELRHRRHRRRPRRDTDDQGQLRRAAVAINQGTVCVATVDDVEPGPRSSSPTGHGRLLVRDRHGHLLRSPSCTLAPDATPTRRACQVGYRPTRRRRHAHGAPAPTTGTTPARSRARAPSQLTVTRRDTDTSGQLHAGLGRDQPGHGLRGHRRRRRPGPAQSSPTGQVDFSSDKPGVFSSPSCTLAATDSDSSSCQVGYRPTADAGTHTITGAYQGTTLHQPSSGTFAVTVTRRDTDTSVSCTPASVAINQGTVCVATVDDVDQGQRSSPTGQVDFSSDKPGVFSSPSCTLAATDSDSSSCQVGYRPTADAGTHTITGAYQGTTLHQPSSGTFAVTVTRRDTDTSVSCTPASVAINQGTVCVATVDDVDQGQRSSPTGQVDFSSDKPGVFSSPSCTLAATDSDSSSCQVGYRPTADAGTHTITGAYQGTTLHQPSSGTFAVTVTRRDTDTSVSCTPASVAINQGTVCVATVDDVDQGQRSSPTGQVDFSSDKPGVFSSPSCTLAATDSDSSSCQVGYRPTADAGTHTITGAYQGTTLHQPSSGTFAVTVTRRDTDTSVSCTPASVAINQGTVCVATVDDVDQGQRSSPTGQVDFSSDKPGVFSSPSCTLAATDSDSSSCQVGYRPTADAGTHTITGAYQGTTLHQPSSGTFAVTVTRRDTDTSVSCTPASVAINQGTVCVATVDDVDQGQRSSPTGQVDFSSDKPGVFSSPSCTLAATDSDSSSCQVGYRPTADAGTHTITGAYQGTTLHQPSSGTFAVTVTRRDTDTSVSCTPASVAINQGTVCVATVDDVDQGQRSSPTGQVDFSSDKPGVFSSPSCTLAATDSDSSSCQVGYRPTADAGTHTITGAYQGTTLHQPVGHLRSDGDPPRHRHQRQLYAGLGRDQPGHGVRGHRRRRRPGPALEPDRAGRLLVRQAGRVHRRPRARSLPPTPTRRAARSATARPPTPARTRSPAPTRARPCTSRARAPSQ